jgi:UDP-N-acetylmuramoyl-L-alanyl-D-glutamate--2,6-diaminopimelate ligase
MEVSSHGIDQHRVRGMKFAVAAFTNLTRDHLDYHGTLEDYFGAKLRLFNGGTGSVPRVAVVNLDDPRGRELLALIPAGVDVVTQTHVVRRRDGRAGCRPRQHQARRAPIVGRQC